MTFADDQSVWPQVESGNQKKNALIRIINKHRNIIIIQILGTIRLESVNSVS